MWNTTTNTTIKYDLEHLLNKMTQIVVQKQKIKYYNKNDY